MEIASSVTADAEAEPVQLQSLADILKERQFHRWYIPRFTSDGKGFEVLLEEWLADDENHILKTIGLPGAGKSVLKDHLMLVLIERALRFPANRAPVAMDFAEAVHRVTRSEGVERPLVAMPADKIVIFLDGYEGRLDPWRNEQA